MLESFRAIVDGDEPPPPGARAPSDEELTRALQVLLKTQVVYADTPGIGRSYEIARHYAPFFTAYFACLGYGFSVSHRDQMLFLTVPPDGVRHDMQAERLRKDETLVLLALRLAYEEGLRQSRASVEGVVASTTDELADSIRTAARIDPPEETRLTEILRFFARRGAVRLGERDRAGRLTPVLVLPGIAVLCPDGWMEQLKAWAASSGTGEDSPAPTRHPGCAADGAINNTD